MSEEPDRNKHAWDAHDMGDDLIKYLMDEDCPYNIAQAALGSAWFRLCSAMEITSKSFGEMCDGMKEEYKSDKNGR